MDRIPQPDIKSIESLSGNKIYELAPGQAFYKTTKTYEIWNEKPLFLVKRFNRKNIGWVNTK
jgi:hypothetical protein